MRSLLNILKNIMTKIKSIDEHMQDSGWITATGNKGVKVQYRKTKDCVYVNASTGTSALTANTWNNIFTLPVGYRPSIDVRLHSDSAGGTASTVCIVNSNGAIQVYITANTMYFGVGGSFPV